MVINNYLVTSLYYFSQSNTNLSSAFAGGIVIQYRTVFLHIFHQQEGLYKVVELQTAMQSEIYKTSQYLTQFIFMAQQLPVCQGLLIIKDSRSHSNTPHSVGLLWTSNRPDADISTRQHTTLTRYIHGFCGIRTRNPNKWEVADPQIRPRGRRDRLFKSIVVNKNTYYISIHYITFLFTTLHFYSLHYISIHYTTFLFTTLHFYSLHYISIHYITFLFTTLHFYSLLYPSNKH
jgi:hypothetical protein